MGQVEKMFRRARAVALKGDAKGIKRKYRLGSVGVRSDGAIVESSNVSCRRPTPYAHAEARLVRKLDFGSKVFVVRIQRDGSVVNAKPCKDCEIAMRLRGVETCYYTISDKEWGVLHL